MTKWTIKKKVEDNKNKMDKLREIVYDIVHKSIIEDNNTDISIHDFTETEIKQVFEQVANDLFWRQLDSY